MSALFCDLEVMEAAMLREDVGATSSPAGRRRNALPDLFTGVDPLAMQRLRCLYHECVTREAAINGGPAEREEEEGDEESGFPGEFPEARALDRADVLQSPRYTRRRNAVPDLSEQLGAVNLRNHLQP